MITISFISPAGGTGKTSLALAMAHHLSQLGRNVRLLQLDPSNTLPFQLGLTQYPAHGLCHALLEGNPLEHVQLQHPYAFQAVAFGQTHTAELLSFQRMCVKEHKRTTKQLTDNTPEDLIQILDLPSWPNSLYDTLLGLTDLNVLLLTPEPQTVLCIDPILPTLQHSRGATYFLMNRFDASKVLHLDLWTLCKTKLGHRLLPFYLHEDQALPESIASGIALFDYAPHSQLLEDQQKLCNWIDAEIP
jgi:cellulose synthase operon protein YhjQ